MMVRRYTPDRTGIRELGRSADVGAACLSAAREIQAWANARDPKGQYVAYRATVTGGYNNESRAGAVVEETGSGDGAENRILARAVNEV